MISLDRALELIGSSATPLGTEMLDLERAAGRVLAAPVVAEIDSPRFDVSSMDGYAVSKDDLSQLPVRLSVVGNSFPAAPFSGRLRPGTCVRVFTGAALPRGANYIVIQENVERSGDCALISAFHEGAPYVRKRASDFATGETLVEKGTVLDPQAMVAVAAGDNAVVETFRRPRVRIVALGDELSQPGSARHHLQSIPDSVSFGVAALAERFGATNLSVLRLKDNLALIQSAAEDASSDADLVVVTGGASVGERDYAKQMFAERGLELIFSKIAIKPGKPAWFGRAGDTLILGLPGNPTSALVTARLLMAPLLAKLQGRDMRQVLQWKRAALLHGVAPCGDRETFHRGSFEDCRASVSRSADSGAQRALARASILIRQPANSPALNAGAIVDVLEF